MKKTWKTFWKVLTSFLNAVSYIAEAGEEYAKDIKEDAAFTSEKSEAKRKKKREAWSAKQP